MTAGGVVFADLDAGAGVRGGVEIEVVGVVVFGRVVGIFGVGVGRGAEHERVRRSQGGAGPQPAGTGAERVVEEVVAGDFCARGRPSGRAGGVGEEELFGDDAPVRPWQRVAFGVLFRVDEVRLDFEVAAFARL